MLAIVAPGQGAQTPGFLAPWLELDSFAARLGWLSAVSGLDLAQYGTTSDAETIRDTAVAQPLLVAAGLVTALELFAKPSEAYGRIGVVAGHSVGEITAAAAVGVMSAESAMVLVRERGKAMAEASAVRPTSMSAVIGGDREAVLAAIDSCELTPANNNGSGQIVAAGTVEQLDQLKDALPPRTRLIPLSVAGAFHTVHMEPAVDHLRRLSAAVYTRDPRVRLLSNRDGQVVPSGREYLNRLVDQVASPVRWDLCMQTMADLGVTGLLELQPAGTLTGIAKRNLKGVELFNLNTPGQLDEARTFIANHSDGETPADLTTTPTWRLVVSPGKGSFVRAEGLDEGHRLERGQIIGSVSNLRGSVTVPAEHGGQVVEWLVEQGDPVSPGQPLLRLHPISERGSRTALDAN
ncbi:acyltransferase domain-containing protein [Luteococcus sp.]|uniref:acyltransferase domain-containing protein n=1 Tax=Luteococcus sp. TaxID=1969402 RepID=UPI0037369E88